MKKIVYLSGGIGGAKFAKGLSKLKNIDFRCFKFISDNADNEAKDDWVDNVSLGAKLFIEKIGSLKD